MHEIVLIGVAWARSYVSWSTASLYMNPTMFGRCWLPLDTGWIKFTTDGARSSNGSNASIGGVFKDSSTKWLCGFSMTVGKDSIFKIEARAVLEGLRMAWERRFKQLDVECGNAILVQTILACKIVNSRMMELQLIHVLLNRNWRVRFRHIPRSHNEVADLLFEGALNGEGGSITFEEPLFSMHDTLSTDDSNHS